MEYQVKTIANESSAANAGGFRRLVFTKPASDTEKEKKQQVNPAPRLLARTLGSI